MKIAVFGGSFDPPHIGHLLVAQQVKKLLNIDQIWFMPIFTHPSTKPLTVTKHRFAMTRLLENDTIKASDFAIEKKLRYEIDILKKLMQTYQQHSFYWICGSDQIENFLKWKNWEELLSKYKIIIYAREGRKEMIEEELQLLTGLRTIPNNIFILTPENLPIINISSETIRERVKQRQSIRGLIAKTVERYIETHHLYST